MVSTDHQTQAVPTDPSPHLDLLKSSVKIRCRVHCALCFSNLTSPQFDKLSKQGNADARLDVKTMSTLPCGKQKNTISVSSGAVCACMCSQHFQQNMDHPGKVANPAGSQLNRDFFFFAVPVRALRMVSRDGFGRPIPRQPPHSPYSG